MKQTILANGVTVITRKMPSRVVATCWQLQGGAAYEQPHQHGAAHFLEHVLISDRQRISRPLEQKGVRINARTDHNIIEMSALCLPDRLQQSLGTLLFNGLVQPGFTIHDVARERQAILMEIVDDNSDKLNRLVVARNKAMFGDSPYARDVLGTSEDVKSLNRSKLRDYLQSVAYGERLLVLAAGQLDHQQVVDTVARHTAALPQGCPLPVASPAPFAPGSLHVKERPQEGDDSAILMASFNVQAATPRLKAVFAVLTFALDEGIESILLQQLRHRSGLVYGAGFSALLRPQSSHADFLLTTSAAQLEATSQRLAETIDVLPRLLTRQAFERAHQQVMTETLSEPDIPEIWIERAGADLANLGRIRSRAEIARNITGVTRDEVMTQAESLRTQPPFVASLGPQRKMQLRQAFDDRLARHYRMP